MLLGKEAVELVLLSRELALDIVDHAGDYRRKKSVSTMLMIQNIGAYKCNANAVRLLDLPATTVMAAGINFGDLVAATLFRLDRWDGLLRAAYIRGDELTILSGCCL